MASHRNRCFEPRNPEVTMGLNHVPCHPKNPFKIVEAFSKTCQQSSGAFVVTQRREREPSWPCRRPSSFALLREGSFERQHLRVCRRNSPGACSPRTRQRGPPLARSFQTAFTRDYAQALGRIVDRRELKAQVRPRRRRSTVSSNSESRPISSGLRKSLREHSSKPD